MLNIFNCRQRYWKLSILSIPGFATRGGETCKILLQILQQFRQIKRKKKLFLFEDQLTAAYVLAQVLNWTGKGVKRERRDYSHNHTHARTYT